MGSMSSANVSKHEKGRRIPTLRNALAYEFVLGTAIRDLYEDVFGQVRVEVCIRARGLCASLERRPPTARRAHRIRVLRNLIAAQEDAIG